MLHLDHLNVKLMTKLIMAACVLHNLCLMLDDFDDSYLLPNDGYDGNGDCDDCRLAGNDVRRIVEEKRNHLMNAFFKLLYCFKELEELDQLLIVINNNFHPLCAHCTY